MINNNLTPAKGRSQDPWQVELFIHTTKDFIVYMHTGKDMFNDIKVRHKEDGKEVVMYGKCNVAQLVQNLVPINQIHKDIPSVVNYGKWKKGPLRRKLDKIAKQARTQARNRFGFGMVSIKQFIEHCKSSKDSAFRANFNEG